MGKALPAILTKKSVNTASSTCFSYVQQWTSVQAGRKKNRSRTFRWDGNTKTGISMLNIQMPEFDVHRYKMCNKMNSLFTLIRLFDGLTLSIQRWAPVSRWLLLRMRSTRPQIAQHLTSASTRVRLKMFVLSSLIDYNCNLVFYKILCRSCSETSIGVGGRS